MADESQLTGARLGRYEVGSAIGEGRSLVVYRARALGVEGFARDVALKVPQRSVAADAVAIDRLLRTARHAIALSHATILQLVDLGHADDPDVTYLVTELARGRDLRSILAALRAGERRVPAGAVLGLGAEIARALDYAHRRRTDEGAIVHGALHLGQVFVTGEGQVKIGDFCIAAEANATPLDDLRALGELLGGFGGVLAHPTPAGFTSLVSDLASATAGDAARFCERLLDSSFDASRAAEDRDPSVLVREAFSERVSASPLFSLEVVEKGSSIDSLLIASFGVGLAAPGGTEIPTGVDGASLHALGLGELDTFDEKRAAITALSVANASKQSAGGCVLVATAPVALDAAKNPREGEATDAVARLAVELGRRASGRCRAAVSATIASRVRGAFVLEEARGDASWIVAERGARGGHGKFVGRGPELRALGVAIQRAAEEGATMLALDGPAGIGKTRLVRELARRVPEARVGFVFVECSDTASHVLLGAVGVLLRNVLGLEGRTSLDAAEVVPLLRGLGLDNAEVASLTRTLGVPFESDRRPPAAHDALASLLGAARGGKPLVIVIDDADQLDPASLSVLRALVSSERGRALPLLFIVVQRSQEDDASSEPGLSLAELDDDAVAQLLAARLGARLIPPELFELCVEHAGGHPQLLEDLVRDLVEAALVRVQAGVAELDGEPPPSFFGAQRATSPASASRLSGEVSAALATAALISDGAHAAEVARVCGMTEEQARRALASLEARGLGRLAEDGALFAARAQARAALDAQPPATRAAMHACAGEIFASRARASADGAVAAGAWLSAAEQFDEAGVPVPAANARCEAARRFERAGSVEAAAGLFARALPQLDDANLAVSSIDAIARLAEIADLRDADVEEGLGHALELADPILSPGEKVGVRLRMASALGRQGMSELAEVLLGQAEALGARDGVASCRVALAAATRDPERAADALEVLEDASDSLNVERLLDAADVAVLLDDPAAARRWLDRAPGAAGGLRALVIAAELALSEGNRSEAKRDFERALELARHGGAAVSAAARAALGVAELSESSRRFSLLTDAVELARQAQDHSSEELALSRLESLENGPGARAAIERRAQRARAQGRLRLARQLERVVGDQEP